MPGQKGGDVRFERALKDIGNFLKQRNDTYVSTMFDYFRIDPEWPGKEEVLQKIHKGVSLNAVQKAAILETATRSEIVKAFAGYNPEKRFVPYVAKDVFEALAFNPRDTQAEPVREKLLRSDWQSRGAS